MSRATLPVGARLGPYEIVTLLGSGGMGDVYRARDPRLGRDVAIKVLPAAFSADPDRLRRFEQEARAAAALNHPNILTVHEVGAHEGAPYVVSELLEGQTLRGVLGGNVAARGAENPLPVKSAIDYAIQIAKGLAVAHEKGIIHRDLKPENLFVTRDGLVKVLDFGLAKLIETVPAGLASTMISTHNIDTTPGLVMGTVGYMSPEQLRAQPIDHRSDIFAFGAILYEMLSGERAFKGDTAADTISAVLSQEPPELSANNAAISPRLGEMVRRCLQKAPDQRFQAARDVAFVIELVGGASHADVALGRTHAAETTRAASGAPIRFGIHEPRSARFATIATGTPQLALTPDGRTLAFTATCADGKERVWLRPLERFDADAIPGTEGAAFPFWSGDARYVGFFAGGTLKTIDVGTATTNVVCEAPGGRGGCWRHDTIVFAPSPRSGLQAVDVSERRPRAITGLDATLAEFSHRWPQFADDGRVIFLNRRMGGQDGIAVVDPSAGQTQALVNSDANGALTGEHLLYVRNQRLLAQRFDGGSKLTGQAVCLTERVRVSGEFGFASFAASVAGPLVYWDGAEPETVLRWVNRAGDDLGPIVPDGSKGFCHPALSRDNRYLAVTLPDARTGFGNVWIVDLLHGRKSRFTFHPLNDVLPIWSPDGTEIAFASSRQIFTQVYRKKADAADSERLFVDPGRFAIPEDWSPDGQWLLYSVETPGSNWDLWIAPASGDAPAQRYVQSGFNSFQGQFSPDGQLVAYTSDESGASEVYVRTFNAPPRQWLVSTNGGTQPRWSRSGDELFYLTPGGEIMCVAVGRDGGYFEAGAAEKLFLTGAWIQSRIGWLTSPSMGASYQVAGDGRRFLITEKHGGNSSAPLHVVLNWTTLLK